MKLYRVLAYLIAAEVIVQGAAIALGMFGLGHWIENGGVADKAAFESSTPAFTGSAGFPVHWVNGTLVVPFLALALLIVSFFVSSVPGRVTWAAIVFCLVVGQVALGLTAHVVVGLGALHGVTAFAVFGAAFHTGHRVSASHPRAARQPESPDHAASSPL